MLPYYTQIYAHSYTLTHADRSSFTYFLSLPACLSHLTLHVAPLAAEGQTKSLLLLQLLHHTRHVPHSLHGGPLKTSLLYVIMCIVLLPRAYRYILCVSPSIGEVATVVKEVRAHKKR